MGLGAIAKPETAEASLFSRWERFYFALVGLSALWIGFWGYFFPSIQKSIPFSLPPLHSRFLGAMYLSAFVLLLGGYLLRSGTEVTVVPVMSAVWTGGIFLVSVLHTDLFDFSTVQAWIWFIAYGAYPPAALWITWRHRGQIFAGPSGDPLPAAVRLYLVVQGILLTVLAAALFVAPSTMVDVWPWEITRELAQLYSAPFLAFGLGSLQLSRVNGWRSLRTGALTLAVFAVGVLSASVIHRDLFTAAELPDRLWFGFFAVFSLALLGMFVRSARNA